MINLQLQKMCSMTAQIEDELDDELVVDDVFLFCQIFQLEPFS